MNIDNGGASPFTLRKHSSSRDIISVHNFEVTVADVTVLTFESPVGTILASYNFGAAGGCVATGQDRYCKFQSAEGGDIILVTNPSVQVNGRMTLEHSDGGIVK